MVSVGPNNLYVLQPTITSIHQRYMYSLTLLVWVKDYYTYNGTSWLTSWLSWAEEHMHIVMSIWSSCSHSTTSCRKQLWYVHFHQSEKQLHTWRQLTSVEQRSVRTLWCSYSPSHCHALQTTTALIHQKCMHFINLSTQSLLLLKWRTTTYMAPAEQRIV